LPQSLTSLILGWNYGHPINPKNCSEQLLSISFTMWKNVKAYARIKYLRIIFVDELC